MFSTPLVILTRTSINKLPTGYQIQSMVNIYINLTHEMTRKNSKKYSLETLHENVKHFRILRGILE